MPIYIALLRGINVGGHSKLPMAALRQLCQDLGLEHVQTYIQSGNIIFSATAAQAKDIAQRLATAIQQTHGFCPEVLVLPAQQLTKLQQKNPFKDVPESALQYFFTGLTQNPEKTCGERSKGLKKPYGSPICVTQVTQKQPPQPNLDRLQALALPNERFALGEQVLYLCAPDGIGRSKLARSIEKALGVPTTARNARTVAKLLQMATR